MRNPEVTQPTMVDESASLQLRLANQEDAEAIVELNTAVFDERVTQWTRDLVSGGHPTVQVDDFTVVEDLSVRQIVSSMGLISQTWAYRGVPFPIARFELVATNPEFRRRGLVRHQFDVQHARSVARGDLVQVITGVDWFYRQFGYEMGIRMWGSQRVDAAQLQAIDRERAGRSRMRPARRADHAFIQNLYEETVRDHLFAAVRSPAEWDYEFNGRSRDNTRRREWLIIERPDGEIIGYVQYLPCLAAPNSPIFRVYQVELKRGVSWLNQWPSLLEALWAKGNALRAAGVLACKELKGLELALERDHPLFRVIPKSWLHVVRPSPWYVRVPSRVAFLRKIQPALERNLLGSAAEGYSGTLLLNFCRGGLRMEFTRGKILAIEKWAPEDLSAGNARLPDGTFVQLLSGWRRTRELAENYPDYRGDHEAEVVLDSLFPSSHNKVWMLASLAVACTSFFKMAVAQLMRSGALLHWLGIADELGTALVT